MLTNVGITVRLLQILLFDDLMFVLASDRNDQCGSKMPNFRYKKNFVCLAVSN